MNCLCFPLPLVSVRLFSVAAALLFPVGLVHGQSITNYIDATADNVDEGNDFFAEAGLLTSGIFTDADVTFTLNGTFTDGSNEFRVGFRLLDPEEESISLDLGGSTGEILWVSNEGGDPADGFTISIDESASGSDSVTENFGGLIQPATALNPALNYNVEVVVQTKTSFFQTDPFTGTITLVTGWVDEDRLKATPQEYLHFLGTSSGDPQLNVLAVLDDLQWTRRSASTEAGSGASAEAFLVQTDVSLNRFDDWSQSPGNDLVNVVYTVELWRENGAADEQIPITEPEQVFTEAVLSHDDSGFFNSIHSESASHSLAVIPDGVQLDPVNETYYVRVDLAHVEVPSTNTRKDGNSLDTPDQRLLHFNGDLAFAGIDTLLEEFTNLPESSVSVASSYVEVDLSGAEGSLVGSPAYGFGPASLRVRLETDGTASVVSPTSPVALNPPSSPDEGVASGVRYRRSNLQLSNNDGLTGDLTVLLPTGMAWSTTPGNLHFNGRLGFNGESFEQDLSPSQASYTFAPGGNLWMMEETKPVLIQGGSLTWIVADGTVEAAATGNAQYTQAQELGSLAGAPVLAGQQFKRSNEQYYRALNGLAGPDVKVSSGSNGQALLTASFSLQSGSFRTHFPHDTQISFTSGTVELQSDLVNPAGSGLSGVGILETRYNQACLDDDCGAGTQMQVMRMGPDSGALSFTADGGLVGTGNVHTSNGAANNLEWGYINPNEFHQSTTAFSRTAFAMPGHFLRGDENTGPDSRHGPGVILFSGFEAENPAVVERPGTSAYEEGLADYAGLNYRTQTSGAVSAVAVLAGKTASFDLTSRCKYYVRPGGLAGIHEAVPGTFPSSLTLYDYELEFTQYGLNYILNEPDESRTDGTINLPYPSAFTQDFEEMSFTCLGGLDSVELPSGSNSQIMRYWLANIEILSLDFASEDACDPEADTYLLAGVAAEAAYINAPLYGTLGFQANGRLMVPSTSTLGEDSRLQLPEVVRFDGPTRQTDSGDPSATETERYQLFPVTSAYYNAYGATSETSEGDGRINFAGTLDVAFFEDLKVHLQTSPRNVAPTQTVPIRLMGGWDESGETFFSSAAFDEDNTGFPNGEDPAVYRNDSGNGGDPRPYLIHAKQSWLGVVNFDYPMAWNNATRSFKAFDSQEDDLLVVSAEHTIDYLSAETAELTVGITYEGMPRINLTNFVINEVDKATGVYQSMLMAAKEPVVGAIEDGIDDMADMLSDRMDALYEEFLFTPVEEDVIEPLFAKLKQAADNGNLESFDVETAVLDSLRNDANNLQKLIEDIADATGAATSLFTEIDGRLEQIDLGLTAIIEGTWVDGSGEVIPDPGGIEPDFAAFLAKDLEGDFQILVPLVEMLLAELAPDISNELNTLLSGAVEDLNGRLNNLFEEAKPTINQLITILTDLRSVVREVRAALEPAGDLLVEIQTIVEKAKGTGDEITTMLDDIAAEIEDFVATIQNSQEFLDTAEEDIKARFRQAVKDNFYASNFVAQIQVTLKQHLYDVDAAINSAIGEVFAQVNTVTRELVSELLSGVDDKINGFLGDIDKVMGAGQLDGYGKFNGDALRMLHVDLYLQLMVPDELELRGYLTIKQLDSEGDDTCSPGTPDAPATEVTVGAIDVPADWISPGIRVSVDGKFTFQSNPSFKLLGMGGGFSLSEGEISFESFKITDMGASLMFGATENYLAAKLGVVFNSYEAFGGVYFGRTCTIKPLEMVDKDVAEVLGEPAPTFTGIYVYGECHIPVSEAALGIPATCFFRISAGVGAGAFYFTEGNTLGGKIFASASGEALCLVSIKGEVTLIGLISNGELSFRGKGRLGGSVGHCPLCVEFSKTATVTFQQGSWDVDI